MGSITYKKKALKGLRKMPSEYADRFRDAFRRIVQGEDAGLDIKVLQGREGYRLRIGGYRAIYELENGRLNVLVLDAGPRGDVYK